jgi:hypothetical protein
MLSDVEYPNQIFRTFLRFREGIEMLSLEDENHIISALSPTNEVLGFTYTDGEGDIEVVMYTRLPVTEAEEDAIEETPVAEILDSFIVEIGEVSEERSRSIIVGSLSEVALTDAVRELFEDLEIRMEDEDDRS